MFDGTFDGNLLALGLGLGDGLVVVVCRLLLQRLTLLRRAAHLCMNMGADMCADMCVDMCVDM